MKMKIESKAIIEEINLEKKLDSNPFLVNEMLFCKKCNLPLNEVVATTSIEVVLFWNEADSTYDVNDDIYNLENATSVHCIRCLSDVLIQK